jgi:transcriptional regulator with XRE-family HTH domain
MQMHRLRPLRLERALTQEQLAAAAGLNPATLVALERGTRSARVTTIKKLADALGVKPQVLTLCRPDVALVATAQ